MSELKPCPFCGGKPARFTWKHNFDEDSYYVTYGCTKKDHAVQVSGDSDLEAIDAWNTRYEPTCTWKVWVPEWEYTGNYDTECGNAFTWEDEKLPMFCPGCGAKVVS